MRESLRKMVSSRQLHCVACAYQIIGHLYCRQFDLRYMVSHKTMKTFSFVLYVAQDDVRVGSKGLLANVHF